jgi:hypothetical protein
MGAMVRSPLGRFLFGISFACAGAVAVPAATAAEKIDRQAVVTRHNPRLAALDPWAPLSVGNGEFCFTADVTGLQTFYDHYRKNGIPLETQARWSWHEEPNPNAFKLADANRDFTAHGKTVGYPTNDKSPAGKWLRENPHTQPLPQLALDLAREGGAPLAPEEITGIAQTLDLWAGRTTSAFRLAEANVRVTVACDPVRNALAIRVESPLVAGGRLGVRLSVPRGYDSAVKNNRALDWSQPATHTTMIRAQNARLLVFEHERDEARYFGSVLGSGPLDARWNGLHDFRLSVGDGEVLEFVVGFVPEGANPLPNAEAVRAASAAAWAGFWRSGGAIDFAGSTDPRAAELERRVVLSQYLTAIQFAGDFPPQESGLTNSTWFGKHHTEMMWWHTAHFALWGRDAFLARNLDAMVNALPAARRIASGRGLRGARWPKMVGPDWRESPGGNPLLVWNQPHPIHLAELLYRNTPTPDTLARYRELVLESAECMAAMLHWDGGKKRYDLGPPLWIAQEIYDQATSMNPCYELSYWSRGLQIAQTWRERLGLGRDEIWDVMIKSLAPLPVKDGKYVALESTPDTWDNPASRHDHPSFLMALGQLPGDGVDRATMARTLDAVLKSWDWEKKIWGWDYPMIAMTAARLGEPQKAVDVLLKTDGPNNSYTANGHNRQRDDLPVYLPGNGALLAAVAMMAAGWDPPAPGSGEANGAATMDAPGFPKDGKWIVRSEGLKPLP